MNIQKILAGIAAAAMVFTSVQMPLPENGKGLIQLTSHAEEVIKSGYCGGELRYWLTDDGVLRIAGNDTMTSHPWVSNDRDHDYSNYYNRTITKVIIEDGVKNICADAFKNCVNLTSITIPSSVKTVGSNAFVKTQAYYTKGGIQYVSSGHGLYAVGSATDITTASFDDDCIVMCDSICINRTALRTVDLPLSLETIPSNAFNGAGLTEITIPSNVKKIGALAFKFCIDMTRVTFSEGLETIGMEAFSNCSRLEKITLPASLKRVGQQAFYDCTSLREVTSLSHDTYYDPSVYEVFEFSSYTDILRYYYSYFDSELNSFDNFFPIDDNNTEDDYTWSFSAETGALVINGSGDLGMGNYDVPWEECRDHIKSVTLLGDVTSVDWDFFYNCKNLVSISLPDSMTKMPSLSGCVSLESINIPAGVTAFGGDCLKNCSSLTELVLSENIKWIAKDAISGCSSLRSITIPNRECIVYDQKGLPETLEVICIEGSDAYNWAVKNGFTITLCSTDIMCVCGVKYNLIDGILYLSEGEMNDFDNTDPPWKGKEFTEVVAEDVQYIGRNAFKGCDGIKKVTFDTFLKRIGDNAFMDCKDLEEFNIKEVPAGDWWGLTEMGDCVFKNCTSLKKFIAPATLNKFGKELFYGCTSLEWFYYDPENPTTGWDDSGEFYYDRDLAAYLDHIRPSVRMFYGCSSLKEIPDVFYGYSNEEAFAYCTSLTYADVRNRVEKGAFKGCTSLSKIYFENVESYLIEENAFENTGITELELVTAINYFDPNRISSEAFKDCKQLKKLTIPGYSDFAIDENAFIGCTALADIDFSGSQAAWGAHFNELNFSGNVTVHPNKGSDFVIGAPSAGGTTTTVGGGSDPAQGTTTTPAPDIPEAYAHGSCSSGISWVVEGHTLIFDGKGKLRSFGNEYKECITKIIIGPDIECIGSNDISFNGNDLFGGMKNLSEVEYMDGCSIKWIYLESFRNCPNLKKLVLPESVEYIRGGIDKKTNDVAIREFYVMRPDCHISLEIDNFDSKEIIFYGQAGSTAEEFASLSLHYSEFRDESLWTGYRPSKDKPENGGGTTTTTVGSSTVQSTTTTACGSDSAPSTTTTADIGSEPAPVTTTAPVPIIPEAQASGTCNGIKEEYEYDRSTKIIWAIDGHTLTIDGEGRYYGKQEPPWMEYKDCITKVIIGSDISGIADNEFVGMKNLTAVEYKEGFSSIEMMSLNAFKGCPKLNKLVVPKSAEYLSGQINMMTDDFEITEIYVMNPQCNITLDLNNYWDNDLIFYSDTSIYGSVYYFTKSNSLSTELRDGSLWTGYRPPNTSGEVEAEEVYYYTDEDDGSLHSELIGSRVYWRVKNGVFTISGSGIPYEEIDISECRDFIKTVKIGNEIQDLSNSAFADCVNLRNVEIDGEKSELLYFSTGWFKGCTDIEPFTLPATLKEIRVEGTDTGAAEFTVLSRDCGIWVSNYAQPLTIRCYSDSKIYKSAQNYDNITVYAIDGQDDNIRLGDVNGDGMVDASDASAILAAYALVSTGGSSPFSDEQTAAADVNADGMVDASDASTVLVFYSYVSTGGVITDMRQWLNGV